MKKIMKLFLLLIFTTSGFAQNNGVNEFNVPVEYYKLDNGLKVILSQDKTSPTAILAVYYNIGFRIEPVYDRIICYCCCLFDHMVVSKKDTGKRVERFAGKR